MRNHMLWGLFATFLLCAAFFISFGGPMAAADDDDEVAVYTIADTTGDWGNPTPYERYARGPGYVRMSFVFDTLVWKDDDGFVPALAQSWEEESETSYLFRLQPDARWHDGESITADDVVFTVDYNEDHPDMWVDNRIIDYAEKVDDHTVRIILSEPYAPFMDQVAGTLPILPEHIYQGVDDPLSLDDSLAWVGSGPYILADYDKAQGTYRYLANDDYYQGSPRVREIRFIKMALEMVPAALNRGEIDAASIEPEMIDQLGSLTVLPLPTHDWTYMLMINHHDSPFSKKEFRQALAYAIDRQKLVDVAARGFGLAGSPGLVPSDHDWYNPGIEQYDYDPDMARSLLAAAGYDGSEVEILIKGGQAKDERIGELIEEDLEAVGIDVNLRSLDSKTVDSKVMGWEFDLALSGHGGLVGDPNFLARDTIDMDSFNSARYDENGELVDLLERESTETDPDSRRDTIDEAQALYAQDMPALSLYYPDFFWAHDDEVDLFFTKNGVALGVPIPLNKLAFL